MVKSNIGFQKKNIISALMNARESQSTAVIQRAVDLTEMILDKIKGKKYREARDGCVAVLSLIDLAKSLYPRFEFIDALNTCSAALNSILSMPELTNHPLPAPLPSSLSAQEKTPTSSKPVKFSSIIGSEEAKQSLFENVVLPLSISESHRKAIFRGVRSGGGNVLLFGPPGTGKTQMAQAAAYESRSQLFYIRPSEILSKYQGESERFLSKLFDDARKAQRAVIFFDEFDALATARGTGDDTGNNRKLLAELLLQLTLHRQHQHSEAQDADSSDCVSSSASSVIVIAATNRLEDLDEAVLRRFDSKVFVGAPSSSERAQMVQFFLTDIEHSLLRTHREEIAASTEGWTGSEIQSLCREAAMIPIREALPYTTEATSDIPSSRKRAAPRQSSLDCKDGLSREDTTIIIRPVHPSDFDIAHDALMKPHLFEQNEFILNNPANNTRVDEERGENATVSPLSASSLRDKQI